MLHVKSTGLDCELPQLQVCTSNRVADEERWLTHYLLYEGRQLPTPGLKVIQFICLILPANQHHQTCPWPAYT